MLQLKNDIHALNNEQFQICENSEFGKLEIAMIDGKPHFPATDCARILGYVDASQAIRMHCKGGVKITTPSLGGPQQKKFIPEGDLYRLIIKSKLPEAEQFERWVFDEVLPSIRKHGAYMTTETMRAIRQSPQFIYTLMQDLEAEQEKNEALEAKIEEDKPKVEFADAVSNTEDLITVERMAKMLCDDGMPMGRNRLMKWLREQGFLRENNLPYQQYIDRGYFRVREIVKETAYGTKVFQQPLITGKGQLYIVEKLKKEIEFSAK